MSLRPARTADAPAVTAVFQAARRVGLPYLPVLHTDAQDHAYFAAVVGRGRVTVAEAGDTVAGFLVLDGDQVDHLYVHPDHQRQGLGAALLRAAQAARPEGLQLWVFQRNVAAIAFYEAHGFAIVEATDGSGNEEREPDCRMVWPTAP